ncbi:activating signal cointegrator 1 complex subunit 2-like [Zingiber officinale]|uniref:activating signal cointegrator 1 complex subunit 2-like n=1 Tax=Zingiber officinale TaxID=94328 RepID=UPI001C4D0B21|nr:activating signal cointegrator 1 complex subunit 2-like [Zingiber officinale]XP_042377039.1 activating signal cointegrator 1 complex subunit 2-like [Zingiber officinale]
MSSAPPQRSQGSRAPYGYQKKFVPRNNPPSSTSTTTAAASSSSSSSSSSTNPSISTGGNLPPSLTTALRNSSSSSSGSRSKEKRGDGGNFIAYLPHDEAIACGLSADAGGLDAIESQMVVDLLNDELSRILKMRPKDFWREVARNDELLEFLDSYLQFRNRWYDFTHRGARGVVAGVIVGELELCRRVFMILYRMSSNKDPGAHPNDCLSMKEHTALLQEKNLLDLPKLLEICAIYGHENEELTKSLVVNAIKAQPKLLNKIDEVVSHFLNIVQTMHERCSSSLEVLFSSGGQEIHGCGQLYKDFLEVMDFVNDAIMTLDAFAATYAPASLYFSLLEFSHGGGDMLKTLARLHDSLLPCLQKSFKIISSSKSDMASNPNDMVTDTLISQRILSGRIVNFGWKLLNYCYLSDNPIEDNLQTTSKMLPAKVEDPVIRGDIIVHTMKEINEEISYNFSENHGNERFLQKLEKEFKILNHINNLQRNGWLYMDEEQFQYLINIASPLNTKSWEREATILTPSIDGKVQTDETVIAESKISQIKDLFPEYGRGFLSACLEVYNQNPEEVIQRILEGTLHEDLLSLDTSLEQIPSRKQASGRNDKGKGLLIDPEPKGNIPSSMGSMSMSKVEDGPTSSSFSSSAGRYTRKTDIVVADSAILDYKTTKDAAKTAALAAEYEYEDEYDDSFDDLGLSIVESVSEEADYLTERVRPIPGMPTGSEIETSSNSNSKWNSKKTQFYVKDGKNYSYKVSGSVAVLNAQDAALVNEAQKEMIHGLGRGGNLPIGAVRRLLDAEEKDNQISDPAGDSGRGNSSQRGRGRRGGGNHHRKDRAIRKHLSGMTGH